MPCPASTKLMRKSRSGQQRVALTSTSSQFVPRCEDRVALIISPSASSGIHLSIGSAAVSDDSVYIPINGTPLVLTLGDHGDMVRGPFYATAPDANINGCYWETLLSGPLE